MSLMSYDPNTTPLSANPSGAPPNFVNPETQAPTVLGTGLFLIILSTLCVGIRLYTNLKNTKSLHIDDYCAVFGLLGAITYWAIIYSLAADGFGRHSWDVPLSFLDNSYLSRQFATQIIISPVKFAVTSAIIILYVRIFGTLKWVRSVSYFLYVLLFLIQVENIGIAIYWYAPRASDTNNIMGALLRLEKTASSAIVNAACTTLLDVVLFLIPLIIAPTLNMTKKRRRAFYVVFLFGLLIIVADVVGIVYKTYGVKHKHGDPFWVGMISIITAYAEVFALIIVSCMPSLFSFYVGTIMTSKFYSTLHSNLTTTRAKSVKSTTVGPDKATSVRSSKSLVNIKENPVIMSEQVDPRNETYEMLDRQEAGLAK